MRVGVIPLPVTVKSEGLKGCPDQHGALQWKSKVVSSRLQRNLDMMKSEENRWRLVSTNDIIRLSNSRDLFNSSNYIQFAKREFSVTVLWPLYIFLSFQVDAIWTHLEIFWAQHPIQNIKQIPKEILEQQPGHTVWLLALAWCLVLEISGLDLGWNAVQRSAIRNMGPWIVKIWWTDMWPVSKETHVPRCTMPSNNDVIYIVYYHRMFCSCSFHPFDIAANMTCSSRLGAKRQYKAARNNCSVFAWKNKVQCRMQGCGGVPESSAESKWQAKDTSAHNLQPNVSKHKNANFIWNTLNPS